MPSSPASPDIPILREGGARGAWPAPLRALVAILAGRAVPVLDGDGWDEFLRLAIDRHRVAPGLLETAAQGGIALPDRVRVALAAETRANAAMALRQKAESVRILGALEGAGCRPVILKGWPLAEELYGSAGLRHAKDLDIYIEPGEIDLTMAALDRLGYRVEATHEGRIPAFGLAAFRAEYNDLCLVSDAADTQVEVHWRNYHFRGWPELRDIPGAFVEHDLDATGISVPRLSPAANLAYLSMHGQQHLWARLKWLLDIARIVRQRPPAALAADLELARSVGAGRPVVLAVRLAGEVFGVPVPEFWPLPAPAERRVLDRFLALIASDRHDPGSFPAKLETYRLSMQLAETAGQRLGVLRYLFWRRVRLGAFRGRLAPT